MQRRRFYVGPAWPPKLSNYDYLSAVGDADWAWEFLRRSPLYQRDHRLYQLFSERPVKHTRGLLLTRTRRRCRRAEGLGPLLLSSIPLSRCSRRRLLGCPAATFRS